MLEFVCSVCNGRGPCKLTIQNSRDIPESLKCVVYDDDTFAEWKLVDEKADNNIDILDCEDCGHCGWDIGKVWLTCNNCGHQVSTEAVFSKLVNKTLLTGER